jgi:hypothetical protein
MIFDITKTDMSYYNSITQKPEYFARAKGLQGQIAYISPDDYMIECAKIHNCPLEHEFRAIDEPSMQRIADFLQAGNLLPLITLDYAGRTQEGRHRAMTAKKLGYDKIPVLVVTKV